MKRVRSVFNRALVALFTTMASAPLWALGGNQADFDPNTGGGGTEMDLDTLQEFLHWLVSGPGGNIIVIIGVIVSLIMVVSSASLRPILFVLGLAVLVGWGPGIFMWIASSGAEADVITAWVASR